jgi:hypothetical protein
MNGMFWGLLLAFAAFVVLLAVVARMRRRVGGGLGPTFLSDGSVTTGPQGHPTHAAGASGEMDGTTRKLS